MVLAVSYRIGLEEEGARALLRLLTEVRSHRPLARDAIRRTLKCNPFFVRFYMRRPEITQSVLADLICRFDHPTWDTTEPVTAGLARGFREGADRAADLMVALDQARAITPQIIQSRVACYLPDDTHLTATVHLTVDGYNGGCMYQNDIGLSVVRTDLDPESLTSTIAHEVHHVGVQWWALQDVRLQQIVAAPSAPHIAVELVIALLAEGMANVFCSPAAVGLATDRSPLSTKIQQKVQTYQDRAHYWFASVDALLGRCLDPDADADVIGQEFQELSHDSDGVLPPLHWVGARMVATINRAGHRRSLLTCVQHLEEFLPLYQSVSDTLTFDPLIVAKFTRLWLS